MNENKNLEILTQNDPYWNCPTPGKAIPSVEPPTQPELCGSSMEG